MRRFLCQTLLASSILLYSGCASLPSNEQLDKWKGQVDSSLATISTGLEEAKATVKELRAAYEAKVEAARAELAAKGAPVDGSQSDMLKWAKDNILLAAGSPGALALWSLWRLLNAKKEKGQLEIEMDHQASALKAVTDTVDSLSPTAQTEFKTLAASSPHMTTAAKLVISEIRDR